LVLGHRRLCQGLLGARTSPPTSGTPRCSNITAYARHSSVLRNHCLCWGLLGALTSPATPRTPRCSNITSYARVSTALEHCSWWLDLATSYRCAIKLLHVVRIRVLILGSTSEVLIHVCRMTSAKLSDYFFFDPATRFILHLPAGSGTKWAHFTLR